MADKRQDNKLAKQEVHSHQGITENVDQLPYDPDKSAEDHLADVNQDLSATHEHDEGQGRLVSLLGEEYIVDYVLDVSVGITGVSARFSPPAVERRYSLQV